jgi:hypothetical protein
MLTSGCALMIACLRVRWGSSVYVQKKSCSLTSNGGAAVVSSCSSRISGDFLFLRELEVVTVEVEAGILNDRYGYIQDFK